jgi:hypothetical protein
MSNSILSLIFPLSGEACPMSNVCAPSKNRLPILSRKLFTDSGAQWYF